MEGKKPYHVWILSALYVKVVRHPFNHIPILFLAYAKISFLLRFICMYHTGFGLYQYCFAMCTHTNE